MRLGRKRKGEEDERKQGFKEIAQINILIIFITQAVYYVCMYM